MALPAAGDADLSAGNREQRPGRADPSLPGIGGSKGPLARANESEMAVRTLRAVAMSSWARIRAAKSCPAGVRWIWSSLRKFSGSLFGKPIASKSRETSRNATLRGRSCAMPCNTPRYSSQRAVRLWSLRSCAWIRMCTCGCGRTASIASSAPEHVRPVCGSRGAVPRVIRPDHVRDDARCQCLDLADHCGVQVRVGPCTRQAAVVEVDPRQRVAWAGQIPGRRVAPRPGCVP